MSGAFLFYYNFTTDCIQDPSAVGCTGNVLLDRSVGAKIMLVPHLKYSSTTEGEKTIEPIVKKYLQKLRYVRYYIFYN